MVKRFSTNMPVPGRPLIRFKRDFEALKVIFYANYFYNLCIKKSGKSWNIIEGILRLIPVSPVHGKPGV